MMVLAYPSGQGFVKGQAVVLDKCCELYQHPAAQGKTEMEWSIALVFKGMGSVTRSLYS
jgi:hypothetical protein